MKSTLGTKLHLWRMTRRPRLFANLLVGKADVKMDDPSHVPGVAQGNARGVLKHERGMHGWWPGNKTIATASRSTGINALARNSIVPGAPRLTPP